MKTKYLGEYYIDYVPWETDKEESDAVLINVDDAGDIYELELFMRQSEIIEGIGEIHAICGETNNSSIVLQFDEDDCEVVKLWRIW